MLTQIKSPKQIVDEILGQEFGYELNKFKKRHLHNNFSIRFSDLTNSLQLRASTKFHHPKYEYLFEILKKHKIVKLKRLLAEPSTLGKSPEYDNEGEALYISPDVIKNWRVDFEAARTVSNSFYESWKDKYAPKTGDIIMARSGEGTIGKVAFFQRERPAIISDFTMRIRPDAAKIDQKYLYYYMMSFIFQSFVEMEKKGMGNMTNIFPSQVENFQIVYREPVEQKNIVRKIEQKLSRQQIMEQKIRDLRNRIDMIIKERLKSGRPG